MYCVMLTADKRAFEVRHFPAVKTLFKAGVERRSDV
jgi:hypothetical protein